MTVLVAYASKHGSTAEIAERIAEVLAGCGLVTACHPVDKVTALDGVAALVLGGAIYAGSWPRAAAAFVDRVVAQVPDLPTWVFSSGPVGNPLKPNERPAPADSLAKKLSPRDHAIFPGAINRKVLSLPERGIARALRIADGDYRDWAEIDAWAGKVAEGAAKL